MLPFLSYSNIIIVFLLFSLPLAFPARNTPFDHHHHLHDGPLTELTAASQPQAQDNNNTWHDFLRFLDAEKGSQISGMSELKRYFQRFGYLNDNFTDMFDDTFQSALLRYQANLGLMTTGKLDSDTMQAIVSPRCGVTDASHHHHHTPLHVTQHYAYFRGEPRWTRASPMILKYAFSSSHMIDYISQSDIKSAFERAFARWSAVIPVNFTEAESYSSADIKIGFYRGDHGDGEPFDGVLGVLAHAFSPENGKLHFDAAERWAVDLKEEKSEEAVDLESVATHEIGHILGLAHSSVKEAVMYPSLSPRSKKVELRIDDVEGIQALYGSNPNFSYTSLLESDISSSGWSLGLNRRRSAKWTPFFIFVGLLVSFFYS